jgi:hypothetical protein
MQHGKMAGKGEMMSGGRLGERNPRDLNVISGNKKGIGGWWIV